MNPTFTIEDSRTGDKREVGPDAMLAILGTQYMRMLVNGAWESQNKCSCLAFGSTVYVARFS